MKANPLISVVLPTYNVSLYIKEAIDSILNQTIQDFEIILIDDGSTDKTVTIIEAIDDVRIRIIKKPINKGLIDSLNIGFKAAKGKYIARMDGDDISLPTRFEKQLHVLENNPEIQVCGCWLQSFGANSRIIKHKEFHAEIKAQLLLGNSMSLGAVMLSRDAFKNYTFDATKIHVEDYDFWARTAWDCKMNNIQEVLYLYRFHEEQVSNVYNKVQKQEDVLIKLDLYHKLDYDKEVFTDEFIVKILFTNKEIEIKDCILFFNWLKKLLEVNRIQNIYEQKALSEVIDILKRSFVFNMFFTNKRNNIDYNLRKEILKILPLNERAYVVINKIRERLKFVIKRF